MNYIGSKYSLIDFLERGILKRVGPRRGLFCDLFAGTGIVGLRFKQLGFRIASNDIQHYAYCLNRAAVQINRMPEFDGLSRHNGRLDGAEGVLSFLNGLEGVEGFIYQNYCPGGTKQSAVKRQYFSDENGMRCDAVRTQIERWRRTGRLNEDEYYYLLASLIDAADRVANTASIYGAFLKHIKKTARKPLLLRKVPVFPSELNHATFNQDGLQVVQELDCDVLYMDPPYNHRQYCANYHVLETIARYDKPKVYGTTGLRPYQDQKSEFCMKKRALPALEEIVRSTSANHVFLSYNNEGIMSRNDIKKVMMKHGEVEVETLRYPRFRADVDRDNRVYKGDWVREYLFCLRKQA